MKRHIVVIWGAVAVLLLHLTNISSAALNVVGSGTAHLNHNGESVFERENGVACGLTAGEVITGEYWVLAGKLDPSIPKLTPLSTSDHFTFVNPSNVGLDNGESKHAVMAHINADSFGNQVEVCVRIEAHLNDIGTVSNTMGYSWFAADLHQLNTGFSEYTMHIFKNYTCHVDTFEDTHTVVVTSLRHVLSASNRYFHYDTVWVTDVRTNTYELCWHDISTPDDNHLDVIVDTLKVTASNGDGNTGYIAGKVNFEWPGGDQHSGFCVVIPFATTWEIPPVMFATLENPGAANSAQDTSAGVFIWVERTSSGEFEICGSHISAVPAEIHFGTPFAIHYFGVLQNPKSDTFTGKKIGHMRLHLDGRCNRGGIFGVVECIYDVSWPVSTYSAQTNRILDWMAEQLEISPSVLQLEYQYSEHQGSQGTDAYYYVSWPSDDPAADHKKLVDKVAFANDPDEGILESMERLSVYWRDYVDNMINWSMSREFLFAYTQFSIDCREIGYEVSTCSSSTCGGQDGSLTISPKISCIDPLGFTSTSSKQISCNLLPCTGSEQSVYPLIIEQEMLNPSEYTPPPPPSGGNTTPPSGGNTTPPSGGGGANASAASKSSNASLIAFIVMAVLFVILIVVSVVFAVKTRKRSAFSDVGSTRVSV